MTKNLASVSILHSTIQGSPIFAIDTHVRTTKFWWENKLSLLLHFMVHSVGSIRAHIQEDNGLFLFINLLFVDVKISLPLRRAQRDNLTSHESFSSS